MSQAKINLIILEPSSDKLEPLIDVLTSSNLVDILRVHTSREATQAVLKFLPCALLVSLHDQNDGRRQVTLLKTMERPIRTDRLKVLVVSKTMFHPMARTISALGVADYAEEPIATKSLLFKLNLMFKSIHAVREKMADTQRKEDVYRAKQDKKFIEEVKLTAEVGTNFKPALQLGTDIFIFMGARPQKVGRQLLLEASGPLPETGDWVEDWGDSTEPPKWRWMPSVPDPDAKPNSSGEGNGWMYSGEKPLYNHQKSKWIMKSERPRLSFMKNGKEVGTKVETDEHGEVSIAEDSEAAKQNLVRNQELAGQARANQLRQANSSLGGKAEQKRNSLPTEKKSQISETPESEREDEDSSSNKPPGIGLADAEGNPFQNMQGGNAPSQDKINGTPAAQGFVNEIRPNVVTSGQEKTSSAALQKERAGKLEIEKANPAKGTLLQGQDAEHAKAPQNFREETRSGLLLDMEKEEIPEGLLNEEQLTSAANSYQDRKGSGTKNYLDRLEEIKNRQKNRLQKNEENRQQRNSPDVEAEKKKEAERNAVLEQARERAKKTLEQLKTKLRERLLNEATGDADTDKEKNGHRNKLGTGAAPKTTKDLDAETGALKENIRLIEEALEGRGPPIDHILPKIEEDERWAQDTTDGRSGPRKFRAIDSLLQDVDEEVEADFDSNNQLEEDHVKLGQGKGINAAKPRATAPTYESKDKRKQASGIARGKAPDLEPLGRQKQGGEDSEEEEQGAIGAGSAVAAKKGGDAKVSDAKGQGQSENQNIKAAAREHEQDDSKKKGDQHRLERDQTVGTGLEHDEISGGEIRSQGSELASGKNEVRKTDQASDINTLASFDGKISTEKQKAAKPEDELSSGKSIESGLSDHQQLEPERASADSRKKSLSLDLLEAESQVFYLEQSEVVPVKGHWQQFSGIWIYLADKTFELGFERLEDILPFWVYSGEVKPSFQSDKKRWEFIGSAPQQVLSSFEAPVLLTDFLDELRNKFQQQVNDAKAEPKKAEKNSLPAEVSEITANGRAQKNAVTAESVAKEAPPAGSTRHPEDSNTDTKDNAAAASAATEKVPALFYLNQSEVTPMDGKWHRIGDEWIYMAEIVYEHGIGDLESILPLWSFKGEKEPVLLSSNRKWEFAEVPPKKLTTENEFSGALLQFLQVLQEVKREQSGENPTTEKLPGEGFSQKRLPNEQAAAQAHRIEEKKGAGDSRNHEGNDDAGKELGAVEAVGKKSLSETESKEQRQEIANDEHVPIEEKMRASKDQEVPAESLATEAKRKPALPLHAREIVVLAVISDLKKQKSGLEEKIPRLIQALRIAFPQFVFDFQAKEAKPASSLGHISLPISSGTAAPQGYFLATPPDARMELTIREDLVLSLFITAISNMAAAGQADNSNEAS